ncbi:hypothetical protein QR680_014714 [Steinernema hermaphroditum]|uniref:CCAAT-binding factor domain-containing protein n=1 Tax=Steinernema hermaphroditum TaxID=289476 RepID=A0AA39I9W8_9BILA|nr:hypothetical protein QR680_014714 [Steinernema hermaphroditum]
MVSEGGEQPVQAEEKPSWVDRFQNVPVDEIYELLKELKAYEIDPDYNKKRKTQEFDDLIKGFVDFITGAGAINKSRVRELTSRFFTFGDINASVLNLLARRVERLTTPEQDFNVFNFLASIPLPSAKFYTLYERNEDLVPTAPSTLKQHYERVWLKFLSHQEADAMSTKLLKKMLPYFTQTVIDELPNAPLFADFLFGVFNRGDVYAVWSLGGIFKLMVNHNFEYPDFYQAVYKMTTPQICYATYREEFFELLNIFLSSSHIPMYIAAAFAKKLARVLLVAKLSAQEPVLCLIRNILIRHPNIRPLLDRKEPQKLESDPYDENELNMQKCGATESSLWELKTLLSHWNPDVSKRAKFVDRELQPVESYVRWRSDDEYFVALMERKFGKEKSAASEDEPQHKKRKVVAEEDEVVPTNFLEPEKEFFSNSLAFTYSDYWA